MNACKPQEKEGRNRASVQDLEIGVVNEGSRKVSLAASRDAEERRRLSVNPDFNNSNNYNPDG